MLRLKFELSAMNFSHKCHFHPDTLITKFCPKQDCTLPLCHTCEAIHLQEHKSNLQEVKLIRFEEAYLNAINKIEGYLEEQRRTYKEAQRRIESDKEAVLKFIGNYYNQALKSLQEVKNKISPVEEKLAKLKRGSIKTLIFYYSGDIKLEKEVVNFEPLIQKLTLQQPQTSTKNLEQQPYKMYPKQSQKRESSNTKISRPLNEQITRPSRIALDEKNVFEGIQQPRINEKREKSRKSIFDNTKKSTIVQNEARERVGKYNYNIQNQQETEFVKISPTFKNIPKNYVDTTQLVNREISYKIEKKQEPLASDLKMNFQNQMMNKFTGTEQYQAYKKQREEKIFQQLSYHNRPVEEKQPYQHKILKTSDLEVENTNTNNSNTHQMQSNIERSQEVQQSIGQRNFVEQGVVRTERLRSLSQANIVNREAGKENLGYDLKKQVLPPQEIRKMLQKRIQERNRILSIKKNEANVGVEDIRTGKNWGQTKVSIINQIYEQKY